VNLSEQWVTMATAPSSSTMRVSVRDLADAVRGQPASDADRSPLTALMSTETLQQFTAALTVLAFVATVLGGVVLAGSKRWSRMRNDLMVVAPWFAATVGVVTTVGSLWFSERTGYVPCRWCWYQRTMAFPLAVVGVVGAVLRDRTWWRITVPLGVIGALLSAWHLLVQTYPTLESDKCAVTVPCATPYFESFGFITLAHMAMVSFCCQIVWWLLARSPHHNRVQSSVESVIEDR
jgi:disulfide bond formation protein DsbB